MNRKLCAEFLRAIGVEEYRLSFAIDMLEIIEKYPNAKMVMGPYGRPKIVLPDNIVMGHPELTKTEGRVCNK